MDDLLQHVSHPALQPALSMQLLVQVSRFAFRSSK